jgi:hypothetical protein
MKYISNPEIFFAHNPGRCHLALFGNIRIAQRFQLYIQIFAGTWGKLLAHVYIHVNCPSLFKKA